MCVLSKLNNILNKFCSEATNYLKINNFDTRNIKISIKDAIHSRFMYTKLNTTKQSVSSHINNLRNKNIDNRNFDNFSRTALYKKESRLPISLYKYLYNYLNDFYTDTFNRDDSIIIVDGVYSNTNIYHNGKIETSMSLGLYSLNSGSCYDIHFTGAGKKNNEKICLQKYIQDNLESFKNKLIICDRAYFCYDFFNFLEMNNINFIIRVRDECDLVTGQTPAKNAKHYKAFLKVKENKNFKIISKLFINDKKLVDKTNSELIINKTSNVHLITNINYDDDKIMNLYKSRWDVEEFFKQLKLNFKFQYFYEYHENDYFKNIYTEMIILLLKQIFIKIYETNNNFINKKSKNIISKKHNKQIYVKEYINENLIISGIFTELLDDIFYSKININSIKSFLNTHIIIYKNNEERTFMRKSKRPFTKWYIKQYHEIYKYKKTSLNEFIKKYEDFKDPEYIKLKEDLKEEKKKLIKNYKKKMEELKNNIET